METTTVTRPTARTRQPHPKPPNPERAWVWLPGLQARFQDKCRCCGSWMGPQGKAHPLPSPVMVLAHLCHILRGLQQVRPPAQPPPEQPRLHALARHSPSPPLWTWQLSLCFTVGLVPPSPS